MSKISQEPLLAENPNRYVMFPIEDQDIEGMEYTTIDQKGISRFDAQKRDNEQNDFVPHV